MSMVFGLWFEIVVKPCAQQHNSMLINNVEIAHVFIDKRRRQKQNLCLLTQVKGFQNYSVAKDLDIVFQGEPFASKIRNYI